MLVAPDSPQPLARALEALIVDPARRRVLGAAGRARVTARFGLERTLSRLAERFGLGIERRAGPVHACEAEVRHPTI